MRSLNRTLAACLLCFALPSATLACLWDYDTLRQERARFPSTLELITGKFLRHSPEFYEWRIQDRLRKLERDPNKPEIYDDLAVAYQKTGQHQKAVEMMLEKEKLFPGLYETYSNLGTFYILAGEFERGLPYIDQALAINPNAHFGREQYQKWLVEYAMTRQVDGSLSFPLRRAPQAGSADPQPLNNFQHFLRQQLGKRQLILDDVKEAVHGVLGMMRFANHDNPLLLEALGDLLSNSGQFALVDPLDDAKRLAARAYLRAASKMQAETAQAAYRKLAEEALGAQSPNVPNQPTLPDIEKELAVELADAESWYAGVKASELRWIQEGKDVDAEFDRLYEEEVLDPESVPMIYRVAAVAAGLGILALILFFVRMATRRGKQTIAQTSLVASKGAS